MKEDTSTNLRQVIPWTLFTGKMILPLFLIIVFCSMTNNLHAQDTRLNLKLENTTLLDAIKQISTTTGMEFFYNTGQVKAYDKRISKEFSDTPLTQVLEFLLDKTPFTYKLEDKTIVIVQRPVQANTPQIKLIELKGVVFDKDTREPLPGVTVMIEGSQQGWYDDASIRTATLVAAVSACIFFYMEKNRHSHYFLLDVFKLRTIRMGILLYLLLMIFNSSAMFVNVFTGIGMKLDNYQNATLGNWCMAGYAIGAISSMILGSKGVHFKYLFAAGFLFLGLSAVFMYFEVQSAGLYERMKYPVIIRATGMMFLYALTAAYATQRMPYKYLSTWICVMLTVRMVLGPGIGGALYSNILQERQQHYVTRYAQNVDMLHPEASASFIQTVQGMQYQGKSKQDAINMAAMSTKGRIQVQATLSAVKEMAGWTIYGCLICMIFVLIIPYPKRKLLT